MNNPKRRKLSTDEPHCSGASGTQSNSQSIENQNVQTLGDASQNLQDTVGTTGGSEITNELSGSFVDSQVNLNEGDVVNTHHHHHYHAESDYPTKQPLSPDEINSIQTKLKRRAAMVIKRRGEHSVSGNVSFRPVSLQMSSDIERSMDGDEFYHYNTRQDLLRIQRHKRNEDLNLNLKELFNERHGNIVALMGQAGMGKTTLSLMMLQLILDKEVLADTEFIFYIPFREINYKTATTLDKFVMTGCNWNAKGDLYSVLEDNSNVVFIFDGLDEAKTEVFEESYTNCDVHVHQKPEVFLSSIFHGNLFPDSKKLITLRPRQFLSLHADHRPSFVVDILGLNATSQEDLCKQICGSSLDHQVMEVFNNYPDISAFCYVPVNCVMSIVVVSKLMKDDEIIGILSLTTVFVEALGIFVRSLHLRNKKGEDVLKLTILAWDGILNGKIIFGEKDFRKVDIDENTFQAFLITFTEEKISFKVLDGDKMSSFSHIIWQELLAAIYIAIRMSATDFKAYIKQLNKPLWEVVSKFLFGFCDSNLQKKLEKIFSPNVFEDWDKKKSMLRELVVKSLDNVKSLQDFLQLCSWIQEARNDELNSAASTHLPQEINIDGPFLPTDAHNLIYVLKLGEQSVTLCLSKAKFIQDSLTRLMNQLSTLPVQIKELVLTENKIGDEGVKAIINGLHMVQTLRLSKCEITGQGAEIIGDALASLSVPIKELQLDGNRIGDKGVRKIAKGLHMVQKLDLLNCEITGQGAKIIGDALASFSVPIKELVLTKNKIGNKGVKAIINGLHMVQTLRLSKCGITGQGTNIIGDALASLSVPMKELDLSWNAIGDESAMEFIRYSKCQILHKVQKLNLWNCGISKPVVKIIEDARNSLPDPKPEVICDLLDEKEEQDIFNFNL